MGRGGAGLAAGVFGAGAEDAGGIAAKNAAAPTAIASGFNGILTTPTRQPPRTGDLAIGSYITDNSRG